eukprot:sb/3469268/
MDSPSLMRTRDDSTMTISATVGEHAWPTEDPIRNRTNQHHHFNSYYCYQRGGGNSCMEGDRGWWTCDIDGTFHGWGHRYQVPGTDTSKHPIRPRYLVHVTGYQPIRDQYYLCSYQGKFQLQMMSATGHCVQEDQPDNVADVTSQFLIRHRVASGTYNPQNSIDRPSLWRYTAITQPFLNQFAKSWAHWKEDIEIYQMRSRKSKLAQIARRSGEKAQLRAKYSLSQDFANWLRNG